MDAPKLLERLTAYGASISGIHDRFMGDVELYEECFLDFLKEENFGILGQALTSGDYGRAFEAAHALKGLSGNLGLTPFYDTLCLLVESLRMKDYRNVRSQYKAVREELHRLEALLVEETAAAPQPREEAVLPEKNVPAPAPKRENNNLLYIGMALVTAVAVISMLFCRLAQNYEDQIDEESANHLAEICYQIKLYIEETIENDWKITYNVANSVVNGPHEDPNTSLLPYMGKVRELWGVSEIILFTQDGFGLCTNGETVENDVALETIYQARARGEYLSVVESKLTYTVPVDTSRQMHGSRIVAVSIMQDVGSFLDNMDFSSFDGRAYMYLTQANGIVISRLTHKDISSAYNFMSLVEDKNLTCLTGKHDHSSKDLLTSSEPLTYLVKDTAEEKYVVSTPILTRHEEMRLFYIVPEAVVNKTLDRFSTRITLLSVLTVMAFSILALILFLFVYRARKKQFDQAIVARERLFDLLVKNSKTAFALFSIEREEPVYISANTEKIIGCKYLAPKRDQDGYHMQNDAGTQTEALKQINAEMAEWDGRGEFRSGYIPNPSGLDTSYYAFQLYPVDEGGTEYIGIAQDVTHQYSREETVRAALAMAERSNAAKTRFLSNMSHDIRTPMNAIINMTDFAIENAGEPRKQREYLQIIRESSDHLLKLINDVLDMSRIESGQAFISAAPFNLKRELERICDIVRPLCAAKKQTFIADFSGVEVQSVLGDELKVSQIFMNLLSNAVKFTPAWGAIRFTAAQIPSLHPDYVAVRFSVEDNGVGIAKENIERIFEPFMRVEDGRAGNTEGTGLGLPIVKSYVAAMGGAVTCESELENGSIFTVQLFFERGEAQAGEKIRPDLKDDAPFRGKRCLLCEDNATNQVIAANVLEKAGFTVEVVPNGREGVNRFTLSQPGYYDIIYMDIRMPVMDGYQAAVAIRESEHPQAKDVPIVAMTANVFAEDIEKARIAGMNGYVGKPIIVLELMDETCRLLNIGG